jgi:hypothetical protein
VVEGVDAVIGEVVSISDTGECITSRRAYDASLLSRELIRFKFSLKLEYEGGLQPPHLNRVYFEEPK